MNRSRDFATVLILGGFSFFLVNCSSMPHQKHKPFTFPRETAFFGDVKRPYKTLGLVRSKVNFQSLDQDNEENELCKNYFNKAVRDLVSMSRDQGGDAVIDVKSVVFLEDGKQETFITPECSDDGFEGQILSQGIAVRWKDTMPPSAPANPISNPAHTSESNQGNSVGVGASSSINSPGSGFGTYEGSTSESPARRD